MPDPVASLHDRLAALARESGRRVAEPATAVDDWTARIESLRTAIRARERRQRVAADALPGEAVAPGVRLVRHVETGIPAPSRDWPWERPEASRHGGPLILLDTETTGLSGGTGTLVFLLGLARWCDEGLQVDQWLLSAPSGECAWLEAIDAAVPRDAVLVSFNGRAFDLPLLATRYRLGRRADPFAPLAHLDLLAPLRRAFAPRWPDCRLMTAEERLLGITRVDDLPGAFAPMAYQAFLRGQDAGALCAVLAHNRRDVIALAHLLPALARVYDDPPAFGADGVAVSERLLRCGRADVAERVLRRTPHDEAALALGRLLRRARRWDEACAVLEPLAQREPGCPRALEALAKLHEHVRRDPAGAATLARRLVELQPDEPRHRVRLQRLDRRLVT
jgi:hypothetical protein